MAATMERLDERLREVESDSRSNRERITAHEDICAERYENINDSIAGMRSVLLKVAFLLLTGMAGVLIKLVFFP
jgi:hypothetical protein